MWVKQEPRRDFDHGDRLAPSVKGRREGMALSAKLAMRQGQSMVLTPQLLQAIKLLQMPNADSRPSSRTNWRRNPLFERADERQPSKAEIEGYDWAPSPARGARGPRRLGHSENLAADGRSRWNELGTESTTPSTPDRAATPARAALPRRRSRVFPRTSWTGVNGRGDEGDAPADIEAYVAEGVESLGRAPRPGRP